MSWVQPLSALAILCALVAVYSNKPTGYYLSTYLSTYLPTYHQIYRPL